MKQKTIYYTDELNDEFSSAQITPRRIDGNYRYIRDGFFGRLAHIFAYRVVAEPLGFLGMKLIYHHRIVNRKVLKQAGKSGYFLYGNHTNAGADPFVPSYVAFPRAPYVIVHPNNVSIPVVGLGGITCGRDALEFIMAGASAVQVGTYNFVDPSTSERVVGEIEAWCERHGVADIAEIRGII